MDLYYMQLVNELRMNRIILNICLIIILKQFLGNK